MVMQSKCDTWVHSTLPRSARSTPIQQKKKKQSDLQKHRVVTYLHKCTLSDHAENFYSAFN